MVLATTLALDGTKDDDKGWRDVAKGTGEEATLADMFDYVCYGKTYKFEDGGDGQTRYVTDHGSGIQVTLADLVLPYSKAYTSFGGLLMALDGPYKKLTPLRVDNVYLLIKR